MAAIGVYKIEGGAEFPGSLVMPCRFQERKSLFGLPSPHVFLKASITGANQNSFRMFHGFGGRRII